MLAVGALLMFVTSLRKSPPISRLMRILSGTDVAFYQMLFSIYRNAYIFVLVYFPTIVNCIVLF